MCRVVEAVAEERLDRPEEGHDHEAVERQLAESHGERVHGSTVTGECYNSMTLGRLSGGEKPGSGVSCAES